MTLTMPFQATGVFYNAERMHSSIDNLTPNEFHDLQSKETQTELA
jgi:transposase InsO family protein